MLRLRSLIVITCLILLFPACKLGRFFVYNFADIRDHQKFSARSLKHSSDSFVFAKSSSSHYPHTLKMNGDSMSLEALLIKNKTVAFIIIKNDSLVYENYFRSYQAQSIVPSFSMAKSITSILIGCAIDDSLILSVDEPICKYLPELKANGLEAVSIKHLLQMTSALDFKESYANPFGEAASFYYGRNLRKEISKLKLKGKPGEEFEYVSGNTQLLGLVLERALKGKSITQYLQEKLWTPLQMEYDASWSIDRKKHGLEKTFCCVNARARDFAKIGRLFLNKGEWNGRQIVSKQWVEASTKAECKDGSSRFYQYQWWLPSQTGDYMANGILGQYIYVNPAQKTVIVRLGSSSGNIDWGDFFGLIANY